MTNRLNKVFVDELRDIFDAERQIAIAMPKLVNAAKSKHLKESLEKHLEETHHQVERLNKIFSVLGITPGGESCQAARGLIEECTHAIEEYPKGELRDAAIIAKAQRIEHYEIAVYGTLVAFGKELDVDSKILSLLKDSLGEEGKADKKLTKIAEGGIFSSGINEKAHK